MGRGARAKVRWHNERVKKKKARDRRARARAAAEPAAAEGQVPPAGGRPPGR